MSEVREIDTSTEPTTQSAAQNLDQNIILIRELMGNIQREMENNPESNDIVNKLKFDLMQIATGPNVLPRDKPDDNDKVEDVPVELESPPNMGDSHKYEWFYQGDINRWIKYGSREDQLKFTTSDIIEQHYRENNNMSSILFEVPHNTYVLNFKNMNQTRRETGNIRLIRRSLVQKNSDVEEPIKIIKCNVNTKQEPDSHNDDSDCLDSDEEKEPIRKEVPIEVERKSTITNVSNDMSITALSRLDSRAVPRPDAFNIDSGQSLEKFFKNFESYCKGSFNCSEDSCIPELGRCLVGEAADIFEALRGPSETYCNIKDKLLKWFEESKLIRKSSKRQLFQDAKMKDESLYVYGVRLEKLFTEAFPSKNPQGSETLVNKYIDTVTGEFREQLITSCSLTKSQGLNLGWSSILNMAIIRDNSVRCREPVVRYREDNVIQCYNVSDKSTRSMGVQCNRNIDVSSDRVIYPTNGKNHAVSDRNYTNSNRGRNYSVNDRKQSNDRDNRVSFDKGPKTVDFCSYCKREYHNFDNCRRRLKQCFNCGSGDHFQRDCREQKGTASNGKNYSYRNDYRKTLN